MDTGLAAKAAAVPSSRPPLRREESTAGHASRAAARNRVSKAFLLSNLFFVY